MPGCDASLAIALRGGPRRFAIRGSLRRWNPPTGQHRNRRAGGDPPGGGAAPDEALSLDELQLAARNHGMPLEALRYDVTPAGLHYLLAVSYTHLTLPTKRI